MGRNDDTWSDRHRAAIGYAQAEMGYSSSQATAAGKRGELGLPPFEMSDSMAREIGQAYRRGEIKPPDIEQTAEDVARRIQAEINRRLGRLLAQGDKAKHYEYKHLAEMQIGALAISGKRAPQKPLRLKPPGTETEDTPRLLAQLLQGTDPTPEDNAGSG